VLFRSPRSKLVLTVCLLLLSGCGQNVCLVSDVPLPPFGQRVSGRAPTGSGGALGNSAAASWAADWIPGGAERKWRFIIIHHSATRSGNAAKFDHDHRERGWDELGYHFVIGNGSMSGNGQIEIGPRWIKQKHGAHCKVRGHEEYNQLGIGICLVGHFNNDLPSEAQMQSLAWLVRNLMHRYGIPKSRVLGHGMLAPTDCPGTRFDFRDLYSRI